MKNSNEYQVKIRLLIGILGTLILGCSTQAYNPGDIYSVADGDGRFGVVKVLAIDPGVIHLRIYRNKFDNRPETLDTKQLSLGRLGDEGGFGIGHLPIDVNGFTDWSPEFMVNDGVTPEELEGYYIWKAESAK